MNVFFATRVLLLAFAMLVSVCCARILCRQIRSFRRFKRLQCAICGYHVTSVHTEICTECGARPSVRRQPRPVLRSLAPLSILILCAASVGTLLSNERMIPSLFPNALLLRCIDPNFSIHSPRTEEQAEFARRYRSAQLPRHIMDRFLQGYFTHNPFVLSRPKWPQGVPLRVYPQLTDWLRHPLHYRRAVLIAPKSTGTIERAHIPLGRLANYAPGLPRPFLWDDGTILLHSRPLINVPVKLRVQELVDDEWVPAYTFEHDVSLHVTTSVSDIVNFAGSASDDAYIIQTLRFTVWRPSSEPLHWECEWPAYFLQFSDCPSFDDKSVALRIELVYAGEVVGFARLWNSGEFSAPATLASVLMQQTCQRIENFDPDDPSWTVRISEDREYALRDFRFDRAWSGEIVAPANAFCESPMQLRP